MSSVMTVHAKIKIRPPMHARLSGMMFALSLPFALASLSAAASLLALVGSYLEGGDEMEPPPLGASSYLPLLSGGGSCALELDWHRSLERARRFIFCALRSNCVRSF